MYSTDTESLEAKSVTYLINEENFNKWRSMGSVSVKLCVEAILLGIREDAPALSGPT